MVSTSFRVALVVLIGFFTVLDVIQTTTVSTKGYEISQLQQHITTLEQDTERLEYTIAKHRSMQSIQERLGGLGLVQVDNPQYVALTSQAVAQR